jgi:small subunit ribosomal protein S16
MSKVIRLAPGGKAGEPFYLVVAAEAKAPRDRYIEVLGLYSNGDLRLKKDRVKFWMQQGAVPSETLASLIERNVQQAAKREKM